MFAKHWLLRKDAFRRLYQLIICIIIFCGLSTLTLVWSDHQSGMAPARHDPAPAYQVRWSSPRLPSLVWCRIRMLAVREWEMLPNQSHWSVCSHGRKNCTLRTHTEKISHAASGWGDHCTFLLIFAFFIALPMTCWSKEHQYLCAGSGGHISNTQWLLNCLWIHFSDNLKSVTGAFPSTCYYLK